MILETLKTTKDLTVFGFAFSVSLGIDYSFTFQNWSQLYEFKLLRNSGKDSVDFQYEDLDLLMRAVGSHLDAMDIRIDLDEMLHLEVKRMVYFK